MAGFVIQCSAPNEPDLSNPYDENSDSYIAGPEIMTHELIDVKAASAQSGGTLGQEYGKPVTQKGVCWSTEQEPDIQDNCTQEGAGNESFISKLTELEPDQRYYVRAYATNEDTTVYGTQREFSTMDGIPKFSEPSIERTITTATISITLESQAGLELMDWGLCYDINPSPDTEDICVSALEGVFLNNTSSQPARRSAGGEARTVVNSSRDVASGEGEKGFSGFSGEPHTFYIDYNDQQHRLRVTVEKNKAFIQLSNLQANQRYYIRPFGKGEILGYRFNDTSETEFITTDATPTVATLPVGNLRAFSALGRGEIIDNGGADIIETGFCYAETPAPDFSDTCTEAEPVENSTVEFEAILADLVHDKEYYIRPYAKNVHSTGWGPEDIFVTEDGKPALNGPNHENVNAFTAVLAGEITYDGGAEILEAGACYGNSIPPDFDDNCLFAAGRIGSFSVELSGLEPSNQYYYRTFATTQVDTAWSALVFFNAETDVSDVQGNQYELTQIGENYWMAENLRVTRYREQNVNITEISSNQAWQEQTGGAYSIYPNAEVDGINNENEMKEAYGVHYNWYAVNRDLKICPPGMKVPSQQDWQQLIEELGGFDEAGGKMKSERREQQYPHPRWDAPNEGADNSSDFKGLPAGIRLGNTGVFEDLGATGYWWTSTSWSNSGAFTYGVEYDKSTVLQRIRNQNVGLPVRCVND